MQTAARSSEQLGAQLRNWRKSRQLTQVQTAERIGLMQKAVSALETDPGRASVERLFQLLSALDLELILRDKGDQHASAREW
jgi:HTH-type transcriptional regulator/antitoxin HipB